MGKSSNWAPVIPVPYVSIAPHRISQYWRYEGLQRRKKKGVSLFTEQGVTTSAHAETHPYGFLDMLEPNFQYCDTDEKRQLEIDRTNKFNEARQSYNNSLQNLLDNKANDISFAAKKRIITSINMFYVLSKEKEYTFVATKGRFKGQLRKRKFRLNFITLTLPCKQMHDDKYIKSKMLESYIEKLKYKFALKSYIWRAERQKNGNIHFHITTNIFMPYDDCRKMWNEVLDKHGYIDAYVSGGGANRNPNSTDIKATHKVKKMAAYVSKYMAKSSGSGLAPIDGRQWFLSSNISKIKPIITEFVGELRDELERFTGGVKNWKEYLYAYVIYVDIFTSDLTGYPALSKLRADFFLENADKIN